MNKDLRSYAKVFKNYFDKKYCDNLVSKIETTNWRQHSFYDPYRNVSESHDRDLFVSLGETVSAKNLTNDLWKVIQKYIDESETIKWFSAWNGYTPVRFNKYTVDTYMRLHCDHIHSIFEGQRKGVPTLSVLGALNDDYEGGELVFWDDEVVELKAGDVMVFPSNFLYPHEVKPILKGIRYSYVSWVW